MRRTLLATVIALFVLAAPAQAQDIAEQLEAIPGMTVVEEKAAPAPYRYFVLEFAQPNDHLKPLRGSFQQRLTVLHRGTDRPTVLHTSGYNVGTSPSRSEPTRLVDGNQVSTEQRFFTPSRPQPPDWTRQLTIWQAASDHHRIVAALDDLYRGRWLSTGASKGGMTSVYHRRFFPNDIDGTVAYVAPNDVVNAEDSRYTRFFERVGTPECRAALTAIEREALGARRADLRARFQATATAEGWTFGNTLRTVDRALEMVVLDTAWAFWQYRRVADCANIPPASAPTDQIYAFLDAVVSFSFYTDQGLEPYVPYYFQAGTQLGYPVPSFARLRGLTRYRGLYQPRALVPRQLRMRFEPWRMRDIDRWVRTRGSELLFVYGENDPWSAEPFELGRGTWDSYWYEAAGANHGANIAALTAPEQAQATAALQRWAAVAPARAARTAKVPKRIRGFDRNDALIRRR
jgi:PS-10 peptidase S37